MKDEYKILLIIAFVVLLAGTPVAVNIMKTEPESFYKYDSLFKLYASRYGVDWKWVKAIALIESDLGRDSRAFSLSTSIDGKSVGIMQLIPSTAAMFEPVSAQGLIDPEISIRIGTKYIKWLKDRVKPPYSIEEFISRGYNGGAGFMNTEKGRTDTPIYYEKFKKALARVNAGEQSKGQRWI